MSTQEQWKRVNDECVRHVWTNSDKTVTVIVSPDFYQGSGTPIDPETGDDLVYSHTEVKVKPTSYFRLSNIIGFRGNPSIPKMSKEPDSKV